MEGMGRETTQGICLDSDASIAIINKLPQGFRILQLIEGKRIFLTSVTVFELFRRQTNLEVIQRFIERFDILSFDEKAAKNASALEKELTKEGRKVAVRDLFIAATVLAHDCHFLTLNTKDFEKIHGLKLVKL